MTTSRLLRIDAVIFLLFAAGHWMGMPWVGALKGEALDALTAAAKTEMPTLGFMRSYWDFHVGFGHMIGVAFVMEAALLWLLAGFAGAGPSIKGLLAVFAVANVAMTVLSVLYFFWPPIIFSAVATLVLIAAWLRAD